MHPHFNPIKCISYGFSNQVMNFSRDTDSIIIGIELCSIPHISDIAVNYTVILCNS